MTKNQLLALAAFITTLANGEGLDPASNETPATPSGDPPKRRGRPPTTEKPPEEKPADVTPPAETKTEPPSEETIAELRALIDPFVKAARGLEVKAVIKKYGESIVDIAGKPGIIASFRQDIKALEY